MAARLASIHRARFTGTSLALISALGAVSWAPDADACGGFFCGRQPVDQTAERILFEVGDGSVTMTTQITFNGRAEDFAWVLPLSEVPAADSLSVFSQRALNALDAGSGPLFNLPDDPECFQNLFRNFPVAESAPPPEDSAGPSPVTVYVQAEVGEYTAAVIGSEDPQALIDWLLTSGYRITQPMFPYIERYTSEGLKFLALKLNDTADVKALSPFRFTLPGTAPSIPLRMTALAAEPEMSIVVFVLGVQRYEGKNWANLDIPDDQIRFNPFSASFNFNVSTNWTTLVAQAVDEAGGQGWVTEFAGSSASYAEQVRQQVENDAFGTEEDRAAAQLLLASLEAQPYLTRLYSRLSAEEMTSDPIFGVSPLGDVVREHQLSRIVNGVDQCAEMPPSTDPCDFTSCGAAGLCRPVPATAMDANAAADALIAGCACLPGATARTSFAPDGVTANVICQDGRMSFLNPGAREDDSAEALPDPCATFSCGENGQCVSVNMTPTCVCDQGFVAVGSFGADGASRTTTCVEPPELVPAQFYEGRLPALPAELPGGREVILTDPLPMPEPGQSEPDPVPSAGFPMPRTNPELTPSTPDPSSPSSSGGGGGLCSLVNAPPRAAGSGATLWALAVAFSASLLRPRARRASRSCKH